MARGARGVTCRECGCLNFSAEYEVCDKCRSKTLTFRPTARRLSSSAIFQTSSSNSNQRGEESASRHHSNSKKRRYDATKHTSNKKHSEDKRPIAPPAAAKKQPDVIDLISDDEEEEKEVVVQKVARESRKTKRIEEEDDEEDGDEEEDRDGPALFQSRLFSTKKFVESDFPSMEASALMRKRAVEKGLSHSQSTIGERVSTPTKTPTLVKNVQVAASQPATTVARPAPEKAVDPRPVEPRPPPIVVVESKKEGEKVKTTTEEKTQNSGQPTILTTGTEKKGSAALTVKEVESADVMEAEQKVEKEDPFFQSRVFDSMGFQPSDFITVFDGLAVARRSHPPPPKAAASSNTASSTSVGQAAVPTGYVSSPANEVKETATTPTVATPPTATKPIPPSATTKTTTGTKAVVVPVTVTSQTASPKEPTTTSPATAKSTTEPMAKSSAVPPRANASKPAPTVVVTLPPAAAKPILAAATPPVKVPPTKAPLAPIQASAILASTSKPVAVATVPSKSSTTPAAAVSKLVPLTSASVTAKAAPGAGTTPKTTAPAARVAAGSVPVKMSSTPTPKSERTQAKDSANVLLPKKKHPEESRHPHEKQRETKPPTNATTLPDADGVLFVKVNAAPREVLLVEPPVLGYCSPDFLAFMRECGDEDMEEDDDPEEVSRSQLKLLDVVDLTNLSDSEGSDTESPLPTPRAGGPAVPQKLPSGKVGSAGQSISVANVTVSGTGTWYVPTLDSDRKRTQPEKVMCELCEEMGNPSRLIRCPTCTKYYHKRCAKENGDENVCWNCELGSMIDDTELDEEHAKHNSEYLAYLKTIRRSSSSDDGEGEDEMGYNENEGQEGEDVAGEEDVEMASPAEGGEDSNTFSEESNAKSAGRRWKEFIGGATADIDASYHEVTKRIAEELRDEEKRRLYSKGFVSREEFEAQMTEVEEYYISEEARLQQLEREKALEAKKAAEVRKEQAAAEQAISGQQPPGNGATTVNNTASMPASVGQGGVDTGVVASSGMLSSSTTTTIVPPSSAPEPPTATPLSNYVTRPPSAIPTAIRTTVPAPPFVPMPATAFAAAFKAAFARATSAPPPPSEP